MRNKKIVSAVIAFVVAGVLAVGVCCLGFASRNKDGKWFGDFKNLSGWHWSDKSPADDKIPAKPDKPDNSTDVSGEGSFLVSPDEGGIMTLSVANDVAAQSADSYTITATVSPENATIKDISWNISFKNASSTWASGKNVTDYVTLVGNGSSATVTCLNPFGEQIIVTATSVSNSSIKATCTLDYVKRVQSTSIWFSGQNENFVPYSTDDLPLDRTYTLGVGTIEGTFTWGDKVKFGINPASNINLEGHRLYPAFEDAQNPYSPAIDDYYILSYDGGDFTVQMSNLVDGSTGCGRITPEALPYFNAIIYDSLNGVQNAGYLSTTYTYSYGTHNEQGTTTSKYFEIDVSAHFTDVSNLNLSDSSLYW